MTSLSLNANVLFPSSIESTYQAGQNAGAIAGSLIEQSSWVQGVSNLSVRIFGVVSGVFLLSNVVGIVSKCKEFIYGPVGEVHRKYQGVFTRVRLGVNLGRDIGLGLSNALRVAGVVQLVFRVVGRAWMYAGLNVVANCFSVVASGCEIVSNVQTIDHINSLLRNKASSFKKEFLLQHRQSSIFSVALAVGNIVMSVLFALSLILGSPVVMGISGVVFLLMTPIQCVAIKQKFQIFLAHSKQNECCQVFN